MKRSGSPHLVTAHGFNLGLMGAVMLAWLVTRAAAAAPKAKRGRAARASA